MFKYFHHFSFHFLDDDVYDDLRAHGRGDDGHGRGHDYGDDGDGGRGGHGGHGGDHDHGHGGDHDHDRGHDDAPILLIIYFLQLRFK